MKRASLRIALVFGLSFITACGRYAPPVSPELTSPQSVEVVDVAERGQAKQGQGVQGSAGSAGRGNTEGLAISWLAPERDMRGQPLKELWGYQVYRLIGEPSTAKNSGASAPANVTVKEGAGAKQTAGAYAGLLEFEKIGEIKDGTVAKLRELQHKAREEGQVERKVKLSREDRLVTFIDRDFKRGRDRVYKIVPINSSFVVPDVDKLVQVKSDEAAIRFELVNNPGFTEPPESEGSNFEDDRIDE